MKSGVWVGHKKLTVKLIATICIKRSHSLVLSAAKACVSSLWICYQSVVSLALRLKLLLYPFIIVVLVNIGRTPGPVPYQALPQLHQWPGRGILA